jgi:hypothetical protein
MYHRSDLFCNFCLTFVLYIIIAQRVRRWYDQCMKYAIFTISIGLLVFSGCVRPSDQKTPAREVPLSQRPAVSTNQALLTNTADQVAPGNDSRSTSFEPTLSGKVDGPGEEGPWDKRLLTAWSSDGLQFERSNEVIADQANVPDLVMDEDGTLYLYYTGWTVGNEQNKTAVAISTDNAASWTHYFIDIEGATEQAPPSDPDVIIDDDGTFILFYSNPSKQLTGPQTYVATGTDGVHFTNHGIAFERPDVVMTDPTFLKIEDNWHLYGYTHETDQVVHATSTDGRLFTQTADQWKFSANGKNQVQANAIPIDDGYRMYTFSLHAPVHSFFSADGNSWTLEDGERMTLDESNGLESAYIKDPAIIQVANGQYLMVYVSVIP